MVMFLFFNDVFIIILSASVFCLHVSQCEGAGSPGIVLTDSCELLCGIELGSSCRAAGALNNGASPPVPPADAFRSDQLQTSFDSR